MIKRAGENVSAIEVECGDHRPPAGRRGLRWSASRTRSATRRSRRWSCATDAELTADEVIDCCRGRLSKFKVPTVVPFVDELPKTSIGKVRKDELRKQLALRESESPA